MEKLTVEELYDLRTYLLAIRDDETMPTSVRSSATDVYSYTSVLVDEQRSAMVEEGEKA
jgi:hypothetical protein